MYVFIVYVLFVLNNSSKKKFKIIWLIIMSIEIINIILYFILLFKSQLKYYFLIYLYFYELFEFFAFFSYTVNQNNNIVLQK